MVLPIITIEKVTLFNPKYFTPESSGVDAFAYDWFGHNNWLVPPMHLVSRCLIHMQLCKAKGTLVMPKWKSALFWPMLVDNFTEHFNKFAIDNQHT
jgi:hypothetical protein